MGPPDTDCIGGDEVFGADGYMEVDACGGCFAGCPFVYEPEMKLLLGFDTCCCCWDCAIVGGPFDNGGASEPAA